LDAKTFQIERKEMQIKYNKLTKELEKSLQSKAISTELELIEKRYIYVYIYKYMYMCIYIYLYIYIYIYIHKYTYIYIYIYQGHDRQVRFISHRA
jgi:hypothetical protein